MLETIEFVRKLDEALDPLWVLTNRGKKGIGKPTLDMPIPTLNPILTDEHVLILIEKLNNSSADVRRELAKLASDFVNEEDKATLSLEKRLADKAEVRAKIEADRLTGKTSQPVKRKPGRPKTVG